MLRAIALGSAVGVLAIGCTSHEPASAPSPAVASAAADEGDTWLLGRVGERGVAACGPEGDQTWLHVGPTIGGVPTTGWSQGDARPHMGAAVLARGAEAPAPALPDIGDRQCPPMQMRSDWVDTPQGIRIQRRPPPLSGFAVSSAHPVDVFAVTREGDELVIVVTNPLPVGLDDVRLTVHYEGCYGKPGTQAQTPAVDPIAPAASATVRVPAILRGASDPGGHDYAAFSVQLDATAPDVVFDLDLPLSALDAAVECP